MGTERSGFASRQQHHVWLPTPVLPLLYWSFCWQAHPEASDQHYVHTYSSKGHRIGDRLVLRCGHNVRHWSPFLRFSGQSKSTIARVNFTNELKHDCPLRVIVTTILKHTTTCVLIHSDPFWHTVPSLRLSNFQKSYCIYTRIVSLVTIKCSDRVSDASEWKWENKGALRPFRSSECK